MTEENVIDLEQSNDGTYVPTGKSTKKKSTFKKRKVPDMGQKRVHTKKPNGLVDSVNEFLDGIEGGLETGERVLNMVDKFKKTFNRKG